MLEVVAALVLLHGPGGREITLNPAAVTTMQASRDGVANTALAPDVKCLINTTDGKFVSVIETCEQVRELIK
jgi:hypothetical protein